MPAARLAHEPRSSGRRRTEPPATRPSSIGGAENGEEVMAPAPDGRSGDACHVAGMLLVAARCHYRLSGMNQLAHGDETVSLLLQLRQRDGECCRGVAATAIGMRDDDGARMDCGQDPG